eukprot:1926823-Rhodomonas_salina.1
MQGTNAWGSGGAYGATGQNNGPTRSAVLSWCMVLRGSAICSYAECGTDERMVLRRKQDRSRQGPASDQGSSPLSPFALAMPCAVLAVAYGPSAMRQRAVLTPIMGLPGGCGGVRKAGWSKALP